MFDGISFVASVLVRNGGRHVTLFLGLGEGLDTAIFVPEEWIVVCTRQLLVDNGCV